MADSKDDKQQIIGYPTICRGCVLRTHWEMMTGYCITGRCAKCGLYGDLAIVKQPMEMQRYVLFAGSNHYPEGGWKDMVGSFDGLIDAVAGIPRDADWWHVLDTKLGEIVKEGTKE